MEKARERAGLAAQLRQLRIDTYALYLAYQDKRVPWYAKVLLAIIVGYAVSPVDLIPDFIPVLGYLDDLVLIPLGVRLAKRLVPREVLEEKRQEASAALAQGTGARSRIAGLVIICIWLLLALWVIKAMVGFRRAGSG